MKRSLAYRRGWSHGKLGKPYNNPYKYIRGKAQERVDWDQGWEDASGKKVPENICIDRIVPMKPVNRDGRVIRDHKKDDHCAT